MSRFVQFTKPCVFYDKENLDGLSRRLKGKSLDIVKFELCKQDALSSVLSILRMLFGQPKIVYDSLIKSITTEPEVKMIVSRVCFHFR